MSEEKRLNQYDLEIIDRLKSTNKPYANRVGQILADDSISLVSGYRTMAEAIIELENSLDKFTAELIKYKIRYGEIK